MSVFVLGFVILPTDSLSINILTATVANWWKTQHNSATGANELDQRSQILPKVKSLGIHLKTALTRDKSTHQCTLTGETALQYF